MLAESPALLTRKDWALIEYRRVITANYDRELAALSAQEFEKRASVSTVHGDSIHGKTLELALLIGSRFDCRKSALMNRLLEGKPALALPPPTSFSYPWYSIIETPGAHPVTLSSVTRHGVSEGLDRLKIAINQCNWSVHGFNQAAQTLIDLEAQLYATKIKHLGVVHYDWTEHLQAQVRLAYQQQPEFVVQHGAWPEFRLFIGTNGADGGGTKVLRRHAESCIKGGDWVSVGSVFDLDRLCMNGRIGKTLGKGEHAHKRLQETRIQFAHDTRHGGSPEAQALILAALEEDVRRYEADPHSGDLVEFVRDQWCLEKI